VQWRSLSVPRRTETVSEAQGLFTVGGVTESHIACKGKPFYVSAAANSEGQAAINFANYAEKSVMITRSRILRRT